MASSGPRPDQSIRLLRGCDRHCGHQYAGNIGSALSPFMIGWLKGITGSFNSGLLVLSLLGSRQRRHYLAHSR